MGYRSEVALAVGKDAMAQFLTTLAKSPEARALCFQGSDEVVKDYDEEGSILFKWSQLKWYDSYEEIRALVDFMDWCDCSGLDEDLIASYKFVRVGDDTDDVESRGEGFMYLHPVTSIHIG
jgi:hypothetical protein